MNPGRLDIVGLGPGPVEWMTPEARALIDNATDLVGYKSYLERLPASPRQNRHSSDNRVELDRAKAALDLALDGARVALVSGGDPGIFAMAAAVFEAVETGDPRWRALAIEVHPGVSAMLAAAARLGAPFGPRLRGDLALRQFEAVERDRTPTACRRPGRLRRGFVQSRLNRAASVDP